MKHVYAFVLMGFVCQQLFLYAFRQPFIFENKTSEAVLVSISHEDLSPVQRSVVEIGERKYFFPTELSYQSPYYINLDGMSSQKNYILRLTHDIQRSRVSACRAYGDLQLLRSTEIIDSIGAGGLENGIILTYTPEYELVVSKVKVAVRGPRHRKQSCVPTCFGCKSAKI